MSKRITRDELTPMQLSLAEMKIKTSLAHPAFANDTSVGRKIKGKSPWVPSVTATVRLGAHLPVPDKCPCCTVGDIECVHHDEVYGKSYGEWPWMLRCDQCDAAVGLHPFTNIPLGTLATKVMRDARMRAKAAFNPLWKDPEMNWTRSEAYAWLAGKLGIARVEDCHIGWMDVAQCDRVVAACKTLR